MSDIPKEQAPDRPKRLQLPQGVFGVLSTIGGLIFSLWAAYKSWRREKKVDQGTTEIESNGGQDADYHGLDDVSSGVYGLPGLRHDTARRQVLHEQTKASGKPKEPDQPVLREGPGPTDQEKKT